MNFRKFVTIRKKKSNTSNASVNTELSERASSDFPNSKHSESPAKSSNVTSFSAQKTIDKVNENLDIIESEARKLKKRLDLRGGCFGSKNLIKVNFPVPNEIGRDIDIRRDGHSEYWYDVLDKRSYKINGVRDLIQTNFEISGRFLPVSDIVLNSSLDSVKETLTVFTEKSENFEDFCRFYHQNRNLEKSLNFLPTSEEFLNRSDNSIEIAVNSFGNSFLSISRKYENIRTKQSIFRTREDQKYLNFLDLAKKLTGKVSIRPPYSLKRLKVAPRKLGRFSSEDYRPLANSSFTLPNEQDPNQLTSQEIRTSAQVENQNANMNVSRLDNSVIKWLSQLIPMLNIHQNEHSATAIKSFMERCRHAWEVLDEDQQRTFLFTIISRMSNTVVKKLDKFTFDSLDDLEKSLKEAHPHASDREYILEQIRQCKQREEEAVEDFVARIRELLERGLSEDANDQEYEKASILSLKKGVKSDVVYVQLIQLGNSATFDELAAKAITAEQGFKLRSRDVLQKPPNPTSTPVDNSLLEQFKRVLSMLESKTSETSTLSTANSQNLSNYSMNAIQTRISNQNNSQEQSSMNWNANTLYKPKVCFNCGKPGHFRNVCRQRRQNNNYSHFHSQGQQATFPRQSFPPNSQPFRNGATETGMHQTFDQTNSRGYATQSDVNKNERLEVCGVCGQSGHNSNSCIRNQPSGSGISEVCQFCDRIGHTAKNCPTIIQGNGRGSAQ